MELDKIRSILPKYMEELNYEIYLNYSGQKLELETNKIITKYAEFFDEKLMEKLRKEEERSLRYISIFLHRNYLAFKVSKRMDKISTKESKLEIEFEGKKISYRILPTLIANESNRTRRKALYEARIKSSYVLNRDIQRLWEEMHRISRKLGFKNYLEYCSYINVKDYNKLEQEAKEFLDRTKSLYFDLMEEKMKEINVDFYESERHDLSFFFRAGQFDRLFPKEKMLDVFRAFLKDMGLSLEEYKNIVLDIEFRERKVTRAFVAPVIVPDKIFLVINPKGGQDDYLSLFHEAGHAFHYANVSRELPVEFRYVGQYSVSETFAFLFEYMFLDEEFLKKYSFYDQKFLEFQYLYKLYFLRRYCSKLLYEIRLNSEGVSPRMSYVYKKIMEDNMITKHERATFLSDIDPNMYTAEYLEAWFFEAQLRDYLENNFGKGWFNKKEAKEFLIKLWSRGFELTTEEMAKELGYKGVESKNALERIVDSLSFKR